MSGSRERDEVERPFIRQLVDMGWKHVTGNLSEPSATGRQSFADVLLLPDLQAALRRINLDPSGQPWLDEGRISQAISELSSIRAAGLLEANQQATELLIKGTLVDGVEGWESGRQRRVHFIDWETPENNRFCVIDQFKVACPAGQAHKHIIPDLVLFINGVSVVVVEAKSPDLEGPIEQAVDQLQRYANRRRGLGVVDVNEGNERLFHTTQLLVATCGVDARMGTFSSLAVHYQGWKDTSPVPMSEVAEALGKAGRPLSAQEMLVAGALRQAHLLDILRHFTLFMEAGGRTIKVVCRYQQFRAVQRAIDGLERGRTRLEDGEHDRRGGLIWHTQGSGKSLTMVFLIRKMRSIPALRGFKVVVVTDRRDLEKQLAETARLTDEVLTRIQAKVRGGRTVSGGEVLQEVLRRPGKDLVFAMIQKYRGEIVDPDTEEVDEEDEASLRPPPKVQALPVLNEDTAILVLVDEAHRSHTNTAHANLMRALPNCAKIGFTGTPILMKAKAKTTRIFGPYIDQYRLREAEQDGATVKILYEGRTSEGAVAGGGKLDQVFEDFLVDRSPEEMERIKQKYATRGEVTEAARLIAAKARDMLRHYIDNALPDGFKAQVVAVSRRATLRYREAFMAARDELVAELEALEPELLALSAEAAQRLDPERAFLLRAHRYLPTLRALEFAPVISGGHNDPVDPTRAWSARAAIDQRIERFKRPLFVDGPNSFDQEGADPLAFLIVKSMLLTGFDAPVAKVMYLDRAIREAELLQAIARVNRTYAREEGKDAGGSKRVVTKTAGLVVDYYGVARHLKEALAAYADEDIDGALESLDDELPKLRDRHRRAVMVFTSRGVEDLDDAEACVELLRDERLRAEFHVKLKDFLATLDLVLPRPEGLEYVQDARQLGYIQAFARNRYRSTERLIGQEVGAKVRQLIDEHVLSLGIDPKIPPVDITSAGYEAHLSGHRSDRAKASEMEHALRYHIRKHLGEDPVFYEKLSERLKGILRDFEGQWSAQVELLRELRQEAVAGRQRDEGTGLDPVTQAPFYDVLKGEVDEGQLDEAMVETLCALTIELVEHVRQELRLVGFWERDQAQEALRGWMIRTLDDADLLPFQRLGAVADILMQIAKSKHTQLIR
ncbi:MAG: type I restriction endonuclease subunit R [Alphaproteobacteria bacterium]|nr:type I restriction endonuclease subunit R [Alphaproteobacteria bacterium]